MPPRVMIFVDFWNTQLSWNEWHQRTDDESPARRRAGRGFVVIHRCGQPETGGMGMGGVPCRRGSPGGSTGASLSGSGLSR